MPKADKDSTGREKQRPIFLVYRLKTSCLVAILWDHQQTFDDVLFSLNFLTLKMNMGMRGASPLGNVQPDCTLQFIKSVGGFHFQFISLFMTAHPSQ